MSRFSNSIEPGGIGNGTADHRVRRWAIRLAGVLVALVFLCWAVRDVPLMEILAEVRRLSGWQLLLIIGVNLGFHLLIGLRWWLVTHAEVPQSSFREMAAVRLAGTATNSVVIIPPAVSSP